MRAQNGTQIPNGSYWDGGYDEDFWERVMSLTGCSEVEREKTTSEEVAVPHR